ncbi:type II and III secretion system protein family protein [Alsobacter sp. SYSU M60028]|uniref:Type II and III secretion system protein family protein n=1 Tax=Alsobacter ponti TaxID=2962936 RepID=A0ABT1LB09_9HYPH|nr:type II and III secretion system protein family protein [Alsobacter ponti]MCP8938138.1 type II and III secretion system protein family protein [Alsobacter ponti]
MTRSPERLRRFLPALVMLGGAALFVPGVAVAQMTETQISMTDGQARRLDMGIGKSVIVDLPRDAKEVFVANPKVANAIVRSTRKLFVIGQADGQTSVVVMDTEGRQIATLDVNVGRDLNLLRRTLKAAVPAGAINVVPVGDTIVLTGTVNSPGDALQAMDIAKGFVATSAIGATAVTGTVVNSLTVRNKDQVMLKVTVSEIQRSVLKQLGINTSGQWQVAGASGSFLTDTPFSLAPQALAATAITGGSGLGPLPNVTLRAAERAGVMRTLAEPTLTAISGESAQFTAGGDVPVPSGESCTAGLVGTTCTTSITYRQVGVVLNFTPVVLSDGRISLHVSTAVTDVDYESQIRISAGAFAPGFKTRKMDTTVELPSGASLVSAGLMQQGNAQAVNGVPGLMNLPVLGAMFRSRDYQRSETELLITVTPYIAKATSERNVARPDDGFADASDPQTVLLGRLNRLYGPPGARPVAYRGKAGFVID